MLVKLKLASFKEEQLPYRSCAASHVGAAVLAQVARSRRSVPLSDEQSLSKTSGMLFFGIPYVFLNSMRYLQNLVKFTFFELQQ